MSIADVIAYRTQTTLTDATPTDVATVTVKNTAAAAKIRFILVAALGAGGAVGAGEAVASICYDVTVVRLAGVNAVATISAAYGSATAKVAGAATITLTAALSAVSGGVTADNTFTIQATVTKGSGASDNHTCFVYSEVLNQAAIGVTVA